METQDYGVQGGDVNGDVSQTMPMLGIYYYFMGFYAIYISSESEISGSETSSTSDEDMENESTTSDRKSDSGNPIFQSLECMQHLTLMLNSSLMIQLLILSDYITRQPLSFGIHLLPLHLPLSKVLPHSILMNLDLLIPIYWIIPLLQ